MISLASLLMLIGVALGALGAHALRPQLIAAGRLEVWHTAVLYQLIHGLALLGLALWMQADPAKRRTASRRIAACWVFGILAFSGSLYALALGAPGWLGPVTPLGGLALLAGWAGLAFAGRPRRAGPSPP